MKVTHMLPGLRVEKEVDSEPVVILSNQIGGFLYLSRRPITKYNGFFINRDMRMFKLLENIRIDKADIVAVENHISFFRRIYADGNEDRIDCFRGIDGISYSLKDKTKIHLDFDCRNAHDLRSFGQCYNVLIDNDAIIIEFIKKTDEREDKDQDTEEFRLYTAMHAEGFKTDDLEKIDAWHEHIFDFDGSRGDYPVERFVYCPFMISCRKLLMGFGRTKEEALAELEKIKTAKHERHRHIPINHCTDERKAAFICAQEAMESLKVEYEGITRLYAGFPWFFQFWSRDECISLGSLIQVGQYDEVKKTLMNYLDFFLEDGRLPNHVPHPHLGSADGVGWFWKRMGDLIYTVEKWDQLDNFFSKEELDRITERLQFSIDNIEKEFMKDGLITNRPQETWMDTAAEGKGARTGAHIEIQALHLSMLHLAQKLTGDDRWKEKEDTLKKTVVGQFWNSPILKDGDIDLTIRPNIFLACYVYPDLLSKEEWTVCFENSLKALWLDWGGLASIDKDHPKFVGNHTGRNDLSYHNGDSWFFINHIAAICLHKTDNIKFKGYIDSIVDASAQEILWSGAAGHAAEVSDANQLTSKGCFGQAWSNATFVELMLEMNHK